MISADFGKNRPKPLKLTETYYLNLRKLTENIFEFEKTWNFDSLGGVGKWRDRTEGLGVGGSISFFYQKPAPDGDNFFVITIPTFPTIPL